LETPKTDSDLSQNILFGKHSRKKNTKKLEKVKKMGHRIKNAKKKKTKF